MECLLRAKSRLIHRSKGLLFDHLVGAREKRRWHGQADCLGSPHINYQLEFAGCLHRQVARLFTFEDTIDTSLPPGGSHQRGRGHKTSTHPPLQKVFQYRPSAACAWQQARPKPLGRPGRRAGDTSDVETKLGISFCPRRRSVVMSVCLRR